MENLVKLVGKGTLVLLVVAVTVAFFALAWKLVARALKNRGPPNSQ